MKRHIILLVMFLFPVLSFANEGEGNDEADTLGYTPIVKSNELVGLTSNYRITSTTQTTASKKKWFKAMRFSGNARLYPYYRNLQEYYDIAPTDGLKLPINITADDGYKQPMMLFRLEANPSAKSWFQTELQFNHFLFTQPDDKTDDEGRRANLFVIFQFQGGIDTRFGHLKIVAGGGVNWYRLSPFSLWGYQYRDDMFERYPWEPEGHDFSRYNSFYEIGDIPRDQRFGMQGTQGFILEGTNMPGGLEAAVLYGKTSSSGGFQSFLSKDPQNMVAARIGKILGDHKVGFNYFNQYGYLDNKVDYKPVLIEGNDTTFVEDNRISQVVTTVDARVSFDYISFFTEFGLGSYFSGDYNKGLKDNAKPGSDNITRYKRDWDETVFFEITTKKELTLIPLRLGIYRIGANVVNLNNAVVNTSVEQAKPGSDVPDEFNTNYFDGMITEVGQLANNRQGINLFAYKNFHYNKIKTKLSIGMAQEITNLVGDLRNGARVNAVAGSGADSLTTVPFTNSITFQHRLNSLPRSRFAFFRRFAGPYGRFHNIFLRSFENVAITDTEVDYKKSFSTIDLELKYKFKFLGKELILSNFTSFNSVQENWSPVPVFSDKAFIRVFYEELMAFYGIHPKLTLVGFFGTERVLGNDRVEVADDNGNLITDGNGRPIADPNGKRVDQTGYGYGLGLDYNFHSRASLHFRHRWFTHKDKNFTQDEFKGNEMTVEFKVFF